MGKIKTTAISDNLLNIYIQIIVLLKNIKIVYKYVLKLLVQIKVFN